MVKTPEVPKQRTNKSKTGSRRSHTLAKLRRVVNSRSPVKVLSKTELRKLNQKQTQPKSVPKKNLAKTKKISVKK